MKKIALLMALLIAVSALFVGCDDSETLYVLNWGDYIDEELLSEFTEETGIQVKYVTMANNEEMLVKLQANDCRFDLCFPSDYIIEKLIQDDLLAEINKENIPNMKNIDERFLNLSFDPDNKYSIPYMWGTVGILYNTTMVKEEVTSWDILWDEKYADQILMYDSIRDSMGVALLKLGYSLNTRNEAEIEEAANALIEQYPLVQAYLGDSIKESMIRGEGALAVVYSGDAMWCMDEEEGNPDLAFANLENSNLWFDNIVIPKTSKNKESAEKFIDFLCRADVAKRNTEYIGYSTPNKAALELLDESYINNPTYNPPAELIANYEIFSDLGDFVSVYNKHWERVKAN